jgi:hypothetical protein
MSQPAEPVMAVYLTVAVRTSAGPGPGPMTLPASEANLLVARKHAVAGTEPPRGFSGQPQPSVRRFDDDTVARGSRHDEGLANR